MDTGFWWGNLKERSFFVDPGLDGKMSLKYFVGLTELGWKGMD